MPTEPTNIPIEIQSEVGGLLNDFIAMGANVRRAVYSPQSFGNWYVDLDFSGFEFRLVKDRSQYRVDEVEPELLHDEGLWQVYAHLPAFEQAVRKWVAARPWA